MSRIFYLCASDSCMHRSRRRTWNVFRHYAQIWTCYYHSSRLCCNLLQKITFYKISHSNGRLIFYGYYSMLVYKDFCRSESKISKPTDWYFFIIFISFIGTCFFFYEKMMSKLIFLVLVQGLKCDLNISNFICCATLVLKTVSVPVLFIDVLFQDNLLY